MKRHDSRSAAHLITIVIFLLASTQAIDAKSNTYAGFGLDAIHVCADPTETLKELRAQGYQGDTPPASKFGPRGMIAGLKKVDGQFQYLLNQMLWDNGRVTLLSYAVRGDGDFEGLFAQLKHRFEAASGQEMRCESRTTRKQCFFRDTKTQSSIMLTVSMSSKTPIKLQARSICQ